MTEPAPQENTGAGVADLDEARARKAKAHRWTRWRDEIPQRYPGAPSRALEVAGELARRADNDTGHCYRSLAGLRSATGLSKRTVQRAIAELSLNELVKVKSNGRGRIDFWLRPLPADAPPWRIRSANVAHQRRHPVASETTPWRTRDATLSHLTGPRTSPTTAPLTPHPSMASVRAVGRLAPGTDPPRPPQGGRQRDRDRWMDELRQWVLDEQLPDEQFDLVVGAIEIRHGVDMPSGQLRAYVLATVKKWGPSPDSPHRASSPAPTAPGQPEQMSMLGKDEQ